VGDNVSFALLILNTTRNNTGVEKLPDFTINGTFNGVDYNSSRYENFTYIFKILSEGNQTINASLDDQNVVLPSFNATFTPSLSGNNLTMYWRNGSVFTVSLLNGTTPLVNETITLNIDGKDYYMVTDENGYVSLHIDLNPGNYTITSTYGNLSLVNNIKVLSTLIGDNLVKYFRNDTQFHILVLDGQGNPLANAMVIVNIHGRFYEIETNDSGIAQLEINLNPGEYIITATPPVGTLMESYNITVLSTIFEVNSSGDQVNNLVKYFRNGTQYYVKVLDDLGNPLAGVNVTMNVHGVFYTRTTNASGIAQLDINLNPGTYVITVIHPVTGLMVSSNITVLSILNGNDLNKTFGSFTPYKVTLLNGTFPSNGQPSSGQIIILNVNGLLFSGNTDENGIVSLGINLNPGTYTITAYYGYVNETTYEYATSNRIVVKP
jgi:hypothetical protein